MTVCRFPKLIGAVAAAVALVGMQSCASNPNVRYYKLGDEISTAAAGADTTRPAVRVERLAVPEPYSGQRIVYRPSKREVGFWDFHRWAEPADRMITSRVAGHLAQSGIFGSVDSFPYTWEHADFVVRGAVLAFEEVDREEGWFGHVRLFMELVDTASGRTLWSSKIDVEKMAEEKEPDAVVEALALALEEAVARAERGMAEAIGAR